MTPISPSCGSVAKRRLASRLALFSLALILPIVFFTTSCSNFSQTAASSQNATSNALSISNSLPPAIVGSAYSAALSVTGGTAPYKFSISDGTLPSGLSLNARTGLISGTPTSVSTYSASVLRQRALSAKPSPITGEPPNDPNGFKVSVSDTNGKSGWNQLSLVVGSSTSGGMAITLSPLSTTVVSGGTEQFTANLVQTSNTAVKWSANAGAISSSGLFTAPSVLSSQTVIVKTTSVADPTVEASAEVTVVPPATGADNRYCGPGDQSSFGSTDGPANLPQRCINTAIANTPSAGKHTTVAAGGDLNSALNKASCGDVILLQAGATFQGPITIPAKSCDQEHWITMRTNASDSSLPAEGTRLTPCYAGVSSLPGRPAYPCSSPKNVLAKIQIANGGGALTIASGANYYRFIGLEVTRQAGTGVGFGLVSMSAADHLILDRVWIHGTALDETTRGIYLGDSTNVAVIDSYLNDFHCISRTGSCTDAQTINGGNSFLPTGPYKIVNNFLEAAAENILWGGANGSTVPADIEIRRNHMFKPMTWMPGSSNFIGKSFIVKNLLEVKNAERLLLEGNVMENSWGGFSQEGWGIVLTPRGAWAADRDITIRYNTVSHVGAGFQITASQAQLSNGVWVDSLASERFSIHDVTVDDMSASAYNGDGVGFQISSGFVVNTPLNNVTINHVTMLTDPNHGVMIVGAAQQNPVLPSNIVITNNIVVAGQYSVWSTGETGSSCAKSAQPLITFNQCWGSTYTVTNNSIIAYPSSQGPWPTGNLFAASTAAVGFANFNNGKGGNYQLLPSSPYVSLGLNLGTPDHTALGADIATLTSQIAGVD